MNLLTEALAVLLAVAVLAGGSAWLQLRHARAEVQSLQRSEAVARADAVLCSAGTKELQRQAEANAERLTAAVKAAKALARVKPLPNPPKAGDGCAKAGAWAAEQAPALVDAWEDGK